MFDVIGQTVKAFSQMRFGDAVPLLCMTLMPQNWMKFFMENSSIQSYFNSRMSEAEKQNTVVTLIMFWCESF